VTFMCVPVVYSHPVHISFELKGTFDSGEETSGRRGVNGLIRSRKRTVLLSACCSSWSTRPCGHRNFGGSNLRPLILTAWLRSQLPRLEWENQEGKTKARKIGPGRLDLNAPDMEGREGRLTLF
jgi:hypothetical protein